ncbi:hypothetical protein ACIGC1_24945 [Peribacillus butanolivorans]|uniref:hypothetical protein n=1 Tax=Peribacillus butanolivorans TaxID=421767 RepID=UPI0037C8C277
MLAKSPPVEVELAPVAKIEDRMIPVDHETEIKIRIYKPEGQGPFLLFVYYYGGGWVLGDIQTWGTTEVLVKKGHSMDFFTFTTLFT